MKNNNWIYIGADINDPMWSKVGKTTRGLQSRHTSTHRPGYFIFAGYHINYANVHNVESDLLSFIESESTEKRQIHFSTGRKSECFNINPHDMMDIVQYFLDINGLLEFDNKTDQLMRYECDREVFDFLNVNYEKNYEVPEWSLSIPISRPENLSRKKSHYFSGNKINTHIV